MKVVFLQTHGTEAMVDDEDYSTICQIPWYAFRADSGKVYARTSHLYPGGSTLMHRLILSMHDLVTTKDPLIDHVDGNGLNNQKCNLRVASYRQNRLNSKDQDNATGYRCVYKVGNRYMAQIKVNGKKIYLGRYSTAEEAHKIAERARAHAAKLIE